VILSATAVPLRVLPTSNSIGAERLRSFDRIVINELAREVSVDGSLIALTPREFSLLSYLAARTGRLLTRRQIVEEVWGEHYSGGPRTVDIHISRLRRKLGAALPLDTLRRVGYRYGSNVEPSGGGAL
jgi:DNA-binding response OmpR family regulator